MSTIDPNIHPHWAAETKELAERLNDLDYYEILGCDMSSDLKVIKARYHALQREFHPDTFFQSPDQALRAAVFLIAKRITEAYVILRSPDKRATYDDNIQGPERLSRLRFTDEVEQQMVRDNKRKKEEVLGKTPQGRKLVQKAISAMRTGDYAGAVRDLQTAALFESDNPSIQERLEEARALLKSNKRK